MSTHLQTPNDIQNIAQKQPLSLKELVFELQSQKSIPTRDRINDWLENAVLSDEDLAPYIAFKEGNYSRHRVCRNEFIEMLVLCWRPGHRTPIHDHNGSHGSVRVHEGRLWETIFHYDEVEGLQYQSARDYAPGAITGSDVPDIHQLGNPDVSEQNLITIHVYAPPLGVLHIYKPGSTKVDLYTPEDIVE